MQSQSCVSNVSSSAVISGNTTETRADVPNTPSNELPGIKAIDQACQSLYSHATSVHHVTAKQPYWMGGEDPLELVKIYFHSETTPPDSDSSLESSSPCHWHYISCGLSDLYGDGRLHDSFSTYSNEAEIHYPKEEKDSLSGFGLELTMRVRCSSSESCSSTKDSVSTPAGIPPMWPVKLLQTLARYIYATQTVLSPGDHIPWNKPLERNLSLKNNSSIVHMLLVLDTELKTVKTPLGHVTFVQVVGITDEELKTVQRSNANSVAKLLAQSMETGGWLGVTDIARNRTAPEGLNATCSTNLDPNCDKSVSNLSGVTCLVTWTHLDSQDCNEEVSWKVDPNDCLTPTGVSQENDGEVTPIPRMDSNSTLVGAIPLLTYSQGVHLFLSNNAWEMLLLVVIERRLMRGRHFTFLHPKSEQAVTLVPQGISGALVDEKQPIVARGRWLQIFTSTETLQQMRSQLSARNESMDLSTVSKFKKTISNFSNLMLKISFLPDSSPFLAMSPCLLPPV